MDNRSSPGTTDWRLPRRTSSGNSLSGQFRIGTIIWAVVYFLFYIAQQLAELLAPLLLIAGIGWSLLPHLISAASGSAATIDPQASDAVSHIAGVIPQQIILSGHTLTPSGLIFDGILLMAVAAAGATVSALAARSM
ncbi:hypothetical protein LOC54_02495 [Acetobacter sp. AN02]|uniref:hypothetical protein n=1 Tax=Acetobacter sp. AN02 TaxID=2894186 RepID=UPI0024342C7F|nr:hypothetical protein [Acetobacter sp. AN02]MDG6093992.1 hypothetical protein [Acetobacter sp. AN02]